MYIAHTHAPHIYTHTPPTTNTVERARREADHVLPTPLPTLDTTTTTQDTQDTTIHPSPAATTLLADVQQWQHTMREALTSGQHGQQGTVGTSPVAAALQGVLAGTLEQAAEEERAWEAAQVARVREEEVVYR